MNRLLCFVFASSLLVLGGCKRGVCEFAEGGFDPMSAAWQPHKDAIPANATVCGHLKPPPGYQGDMGKVLQIDFENDDNPWVTIVDHMEKQGYKRTSQKVDSPDHQQAFLEKDKVVIHVNTIRDKGRFRAVLRLGN